MQLEQEIWLERGILVHDLKEDDLNVIFQRYKRLNMVPEGYKYPELVKTEQLPRAMREMLERKAAHYGLSNND